jgi:hypothetical protein
MQGVRLRQFAVGVSVFLTGGVLMKLVLLGIIGITAVVVSLVLCVVYAVCSARGFMRYDEPF